MEELDEFGIPIRKPAQLDEFGIPIKKKVVSQSGSTGGGKTSSSGSNVFQAPLNTQAPTVLTPKKKAEYLQKQQTEKKQLSDQLKSATKAYASNQDIETVEEIDLYKNKDQPFNTVKEPDKDPSFLQSVSNTVSNIGTGLQQFIPNTQIALGDGLTKILGKDLGSAVYGQMTHGGDPEVQRIEAYNKLAELEPQFKHTRGLIESGEKFDLPGLAAATVDAVGSLVRTAVTSIPTAGLGLYSDMVGSSVANYNKQKAKSLGMTVNELYDKGENDYFVPATIGSVGAQMEKIGLKGATNLINRELTGTAAKKMALVFADVNKEGLTEWVQTGLEKGNTSVASGKDALDATWDAVKEMFSKKGLEAYLMGVVGSGGAAGLGRIAKGITNPKNKAKVEEDVNTINRFTEEIVNPDASPATKAFVEKQIRAKVADVASTIDEDVESVEKFGADQKQAITDLQGQIEQAEQVISDPSLTPETKLLAEEELTTLTKELETTLKEKPKLTDKDAVIEEEVNAPEIVEEQVVETPDEVIESETVIQEPAKKTTPFKIYDKDMGVLGMDNDVADENIFLLDENTGDVTLNEEGYQYGYSDPRYYWDGLFNIDFDLGDKPKFKDLQITPAKLSKDGFLIQKGTLSLKEEGGQRAVQIESANAIPVQPTPSDSGTLEQGVSESRGEEVTQESISEEVPINKEEIEAPERERGSHKIVKSEDNTTLDDMTKGGNLVPDDFYDKPQFYTDVNNKASKESLTVIKKAKGNPESEVTIYRAVPNGVENIDEGDWVSLSPTYAKEHGMHPTDESQDMPVISMKVKVKDIVWDGNDVNEFAYFPTKEEINEQETQTQANQDNGLNTARGSDTAVKEEVKAGDPLRALADKIEKGKINKLGGFKASTGFDAVWDGSLTVVAQSLRTGAKLADAIESGLKHIRKTDWYKNLTDKKDFESKYKAHLTSEYEADTTTLRNADVEQKREDYGFNEPLPKTKVTNEETLNKAQEAIKNDSQIAYDVMDKAINGESLTATEMAILAQFQGIKEAELIRANEKIEQAKDSSVLAFNNAVDARNKVIDDLIMSYDASELSGTTAGRALQARKIKVLQDYSLANMLIRVRKANNNQQLTNEQIADVTQKYEALIETERKLNEKLEKLQEENSKLKLKEFTPKIRVEAAREARENKRTQTKETLKKERDSIFEEMRKVIKKSRGEVSMNPIPVEMVPLVGKLAKNYFVDGMTSIEAIVDKIHGDLVDIVEGVTKRDVRDAISGYNRDTRPTKDDLQKDIQDLKTQAKLISQIEDAENGVKKAKDETKRKKASDEVEMLRARLKDLTKGETALEGLKTRIKKQISDTQKKLDNKDYSKKESTEVPLDEEARKLQDAYRKIKYEFDVAVAKDQLATRTRDQKLKDLMIEIWNIPRALMATADLSAPLRQGILPTISNPIMAQRAFVEMLKQWNSENRADRWLADLKDSPGYQLMQESGLYIADKTNPSITAKEEDFQTNLAEKLPILGKGFKLKDAGVLKDSKVGDIQWGEFKVGDKKIGNIELIGRSERAYVSYLNKMRVDLFTEGAEVLQRDGMSYASHPKAYEALATYINASTGRGNLGALERAAPVLNAMFFSPRLMASRIQLLTNFANPYFYKNTPYAVRKMYFSDMAKFISFGVGILALAGMGGADVEDDPRSPDFGKIKKGNTRWDIWGGFQQFARYFSQIASGEKKSSASGKITKLDGTSYTKETRGSVALDLVRSKLAPVPAFIVNWFAGKNMVGDKFDATKDVGNMLYPLVWQGIYDSYKQDGALFAVGATGIPSMLGVGVQTYGVNDFLQQGVDKKIIDLLRSKKAVAIEPREGDKKIYDVKTGDEREMTDAEFKKYYASWVEGIKQGVNSDYDRLSKLTNSQFEKEFRSIKTMASKQAKEAVVGLPLELRNFREDDVTYELTPEQLKVRNQFYKEYLEDNKDNYDSDKESQDKLLRKAREYSKKQFKAEGYEPDAEGKYKLNLKE